MKEEGLEAVFLGFAIRTEVIQLQKTTGLLSLPGTSILGEGRGGLRFWEERFEVVQELLERWCCFFFDQLDLCSLVETQIRSIGLKDTS